MTVATHRPRPALGPVAALLGVIAIALGVQFLPSAPASDLPADFAEPLLELPATEPGTAPVSATIDPAAELAAVREEVVFWGERLRTRPEDLVSALRLGDAHVAEARLTGSVTAYVQAEAAVATALRIQPGYLPARARQASILASLHRFDEARVVARAVLAEDPANLTALGALGDSALEQGDLAEGRRAYEALSVLAAGPASQVRRARLAFIEGDGPQAVADARAALTAAIGDGAQGSSLAFSHTVLADVLVATGDADGARASYEAATAASPGWAPAMVGLAQLDAAAGALDAAIARLDLVIGDGSPHHALALRADLLRLRGAPGDLPRAADDDAAVEAVLQPDAAAPFVYRRELALFLAGPGRDPGRAVELARADLEVRSDVFGHDTYAWVLLAAGQAEAADAAMAKALAAGTRDAQLLHHAGMIALANGRPDEARRLLREALRLEPSFDPLAVAQARETLAMLD